MSKRAISTQEQWTAVDHYITDLFIPHDKVQEATLRESDAAKLPQIAVSAAQGKLLMLLAKACGARNILEIGTLGGYSTIWLARALPADGKLISLEYDPKHAEVARRNIAHAGLADRVDVRVGKALDTLPTLEAEHRGPFDLVFIDADKASYPEYLQWSLKLTPVGGLIIADNVVRDGEIVNPASADPNVPGIRKFHEMLAAEPRLSATAIQTVGCKGYDGFAIGLVLA